jgi:hypothetical protein
MTFEEPKVEFIEIENVDTAEESGVPSMEQCQGPDAPGNNCSKYGFTLMNN